MNEGGRDLNEFRIATSRTEDRIEVRSEGVWIVDVASFKRFNRARCFFVVLSILSLYPIKYNFILTRRSNDNNSPNGLEV